MVMNAAQTLAVESWTLYAVAILVVVCRTYVKYTSSKFLVSLLRAA